MTVDVSALKTHLAKFGQQHLLSFWEQLDSPTQEAFAKQIENIDFAMIQSVVSGEHQGDDWEALASRSISPPAIRLDGDGNIAADAAALAEGESALRSGKVGVILVAGGQGSRLGFDHPKGMYSIGPVSGRTLFEMHMDRLIAIGDRYGVKIPLYLMTSPATHDETVSYFADNKNFGMSEDQVTIFCQGTMPAVDADSGKMLLDSLGEISLSPDGHGGTLAALVNQGCLDRMQNDGIEQLFYFQVDNPLVDIADPQFIGHHLLAGSEMTTQVVAKTEAQDKVGNVVSVDGHLQIIEYSDLPPEPADRRNPDGSLMIWAGSIAVHMFDCAFLRRMVEELGGLPWHLARKKVPFIDEQANRMEPSEPNAIKLETFIFDLLPNAKNAFVVEISEQDAFAPLKNASGAPKDTPETCRAAISGRYRRWLEAVGAMVDSNALVEIRSGFALDADELSEKIEPGTQVSANKYFA